MANSRNMKVASIQSAVLIAGCLCAISGASAANPNAVEQLQAQPTSLNAILNASFDQPVIADEAVMQLVRDDEFGGDDRPKVNVGRAVGLSFLLPGAGHWAMGSRRRAGVYFGAEAVAWTAFGYFKTVQHQKQDDYELYARSHAGIDPTGKDDEFYRTLTFYLSREQFNDEGRLIDPSRPYYPDDPQWDWQWESESAMARYRDMRNQSNEAEQRSKFSLGAALLNRVVAAADAWRTARAINREARMENASWKVRLKGKPGGSNPGLMVYLSRPLH